jgi:hypothetical protein
MLIDFVLAETGEMMAKYSNVAMLATAAAIAMNVSAAKAEPAIGVAVAAPLTPVTLGTAAVVSVLANEAFAKKPLKTAKSSRYLPYPSR